MSGDAAADSVNSTNSADSGDSLRAALRRFTAARVALGRHGASLPTSPQLALQLAHATARDAVHAALDVDALRDVLRTGLAGMPGAAVQGSVILHSAAATREVYLQRPDLGRQLSAESGEALLALRVTVAPPDPDPGPGPSPGAALSPRAALSPGGALSPGAPPSPDAALSPGAGPGPGPAQGHAAAIDAGTIPSDLAIVIADGLSSLAIQQHAVPFLQALLPRLQADNFTIAPLTIAQQARVAIGDEIGELLQAKAVVVLIGERPGLSSPDSMGIYMTWAPRRGLTDEARNCISNVRPAGLSYEEAAYRLHYLLDQSRQRQLSGVQLKDETSAPAGLLSRKRNFLVL